MSEPEVLTDYVNKCETCAYANDKSNARCVACGEPIFAWVEATWHMEQRLEAAIAADRTRIEAAERVESAANSALVAYCAVGPKVLNEQMKRLQAAIEAYRRDYPEGKK